ncbi:MAG: hypothetical protein HC888_00245 [Candidatus Competibacteraceae bacterium]|nr:hypothetical protein [Candidatus Competibacteraceae bacterium]
MNRAERLKLEVQQKIKEPDFYAVSGSKLYGTNRPSSDDDFRGFGMAPTSLLIDGVPVKGNMTKFEYSELTEDDAKMFSVSRFLKLTLTGDPQLTELFYVPEDKIVRATELGRRVIAMRDKIVSQAVFRSIMGFGYSEWRKACGQKLVIHYKKEDKEIIEWVRNCKTWDKDRMDTFVEWMSEDAEKELVDSKRNLGRKRLNEFDKFGFGVSSAAHAIRLSQELEELMLTGNITFPRPNADFLRSIREGKYKLDELQKVYDESKAKADEALAKSVLPPFPDIEYVCDEYERMVREAIRNDKAF